MPPLRRVFQITRMPLRIRSDEISCLKIWDSIPSYSIIPPFVCHCFPTSDITWPWKNGPNPQFWETLLPKNAHVLRINPNSFMIQHVSLSDTTCDVFDAPSAVTCRQWRALSSVCLPFQPWLPYRPGVRWHATIPFNPRWFAIISVMEITVKKHITYHLQSLLDSQ